MLPADPADVELVRHRLQCHVSGLVEVASHVDAARCAYHFDMVIVVQHDWPIVFIAPACQKGRSAGQQALQK